MADNFHAMSKTSVCCYEEISSMLTNSNIKVWDMFMRISSRCQGSTLSLSKTLTLLRATVVI